MSEEKKNRAVFIQPPKPVNEMNEEELDDFAEKILEALTGKKEGDGKKNDEE